MRILPDSVVAGSGLFALFTLSFPWAVFFFSMLEANLLGSLFRTVAASLNIAYLPPAPKDAKCRTSFGAPTLSSLSLFASPNSYPFPSYAIYTMTVAASYMFSTLIHQSKELQALGPQYSTRYYISMLLLALFFFVFILFRLMMGCETFGVAILTMVTAAIVGTFLVYQNRQLFGKSGDQAVNLLGIPLLKSRTASGKPLYVCM